MQPTAVFLSGDSHGQRSWWATVSGVTKSRTQLSTHPHTHVYNDVSIYSVCLYNHCRRRWHPTPVLLPGKSHGQRSLVGCGPRGREELDKTERFPFHFSLSCTGDGNGNPVQCSCLENPRDGGAWRAAMYGVTQSWTRLK